jgi:hypothetical protein
MLKITKKNFIFQLIVCKEIDEMMMMNDGGNDKLGENHFVGGDLYTRPVTIIHREKQRRIIK